MRLTVQNISKRIGGKDLFVDFSMDLQDGMRLCICGANGAGKSVLMRIMAMQDDVDSGKVLIDKYSNIGYVEQEFKNEDMEKELLNYVMTALPDWSLFWLEWDKAVQEKNESLLKELSEKQARIEGSYGYDAEHHCGAILSGLGFPVEEHRKKIREFSGGFRERAKLARVLVSGVDILLLDEPINHLDLEAIEWLENFLLSYEGIIVFIAHDRVFMDTIATHTLYLGTGKPFFRKANYTQLMNQFEEREEQKRREVKKLSQEIDDKMVFVERFKAKASKARQANSKQKMAKRLEKELRLLEPEKKANTVSIAFPTPQKMDTILVTAENIEHYYPGRKSLWAPLSFSLYKGDKIALVGKNGSGKSTLLKNIIGKLLPTGGSLFLSPTVKIGYFAQHQTDILILENTVLTEIRRLSDPKTTEEELMGTLGRFMLGQEFFERKVSALSGGEKNRLVLATLFLCRANLLVLDEPTNHLDLETRDSLITALKNFQGSIIMIAHDRHLLASVSSGYWLLSESGLRVFTTFSEYVSGREFDFLQSSSVVEKKIDRKEQKRILAQKRSEIFKELQPKKDVYAAKEIVLAQVLAAIVVLEEKMAQPQFYDISSDVTLALKELHNLQKTSECYLEELSVLEEEITNLEALQKELSANK
ncbi:MAG: ABC-F family ATP-binding cassette domain-containing protein [Desulfovibrionaceae bacterium]